ncbi:predicted protein [Nematostella vectensis]|uniref:Mitochondrial fission factor n=1 Tax=Nematostella vectensis TaxID=45351 RepID=A7SJ43_NEMVE|nr:mitochondrial fission factor [Nematostella vectensis]EDO36292.1 predicted protein [Nematostella vectensis]|eukprot:XP_001628355.1 predicted protein [Nematostella vectensis]
MAANQALDFSDFHQEPDITATMRMPETIRVEPEHSDFFYSSQTNAQGELNRNTNPMNVPDRIVINGELGAFSGKRDEFPRELKDDFVPNPTINTFMGGMITPPRTLTVDDTTSAHYPQGKPAPGKRAEKHQHHQHHHIKTDSQERCQIDVESIKTGLEIAEQVNPMDSDSEEEYATEYEVTDLRKSVCILHRRVSMLEKEVDRNTMGFWSKMFIFTMTIVNPLLLQWLFGGRRR